MLSDRDVTTCRSCGQPIRWTTTAKNGAAQAVNADPDPTGNTAVYRDAEGHLRSRGLTKEHPEPKGHEQRFVPHFATCTARPRRSSNGQRGRADAWSTPRTGWAR